MKAPKTPRSRPAAAAKVAKPAQSAGAAKAGKAAPKGRATAKPDATAPTAAPVAAPVKRKPAAPRAPKTPPPPVIPALIADLVRALDGKKAEQLRVLNVSGLSSITNFLILATATSEPHLRALRVETEKVIDAAQVKILGMDTGRESGWTVVDAFDVMVHLFSSDNRSKYRLETLWRDATTVDISSVVTPQNPP